MKPAKLANRRTICVLLNKERNPDRFQMKHEAKRKGDSVLDLCGIRSLDSIPDKESDNDGSSDSSDKSAAEDEDSQERDGGAAVPRKLQFSPSERDDDERREKKGSGDEEEEEVEEDEDSYDSSFIDDEAEEHSESESELSSEADESFHDDDESLHDDEENTSPSNWRSTSPAPTPKTKRKEGAKRTPLSQLNNGQQQPPTVLLTFLQSLSLMQPDERCVE